MSGVLIAGSFARVIFAAALVGLAAGWVVEARSDFDPFSIWGLIVLLLVMALAAIVTVRER